ncbi:uncharacterized protein [Branchiostoma lanceolatum]|uniref:uncharacterized protein isoform X2 n=1 Tax=Branchiostoma lanceolatum TaxID=7740 RepID=UPI0034539F4D
MGVLNVVTVVLAVLVALQESGQTTGHDISEDTEPCLPCEELDQLKNDLMKMQAETDNTFSMLEANATKDRQALRHMWRKTHEQENRIVELEGQVGNLTGDKVRMDKQVGILTDTVNRLIHKKVVNVALGKAANQTSTHGPGAASRAVDGDTNTTFDAGTCTHTQEEDNPTWWVDLGQSYTVERVVIFNRQDNSAERLNPFNIHIGDSDQVNENLQCGGDHEIDVDEASISVSCHGMRGRYVAIDLPGPRRTLTLCEVKVFSAPKKWRTDGHCGQGYPAEDGYPAECDPVGVAPCCSSNNQCGITAADCDCPTCVDYRNPLPATTSPATTSPATTPPATTSPATTPPVGTQLRNGYKESVVNVALGKAANQTSTYGTGAASRAVDGDTNTTFDAGTCTHTQEEDNPTWWVDLGQSYTVERVVIFNRQDNSAERLNPFNIHIGDSDQVNENLQCGGDHEIDVDEASISVSCHGMRGRYVAIDLPGPRRTLTLCEVKVFSAPKKWRTDGRCGQGYPAEDGYPAECDPVGVAPCCSSNNHCGITAADCDCPTCVDYRNPLPGCPHGYVQFEDRCFSLSTDKKNYTEAKSACQAAGGRLAMPKNQATNDFLVDRIKIRIKDRSISGVWLGLAKVKDQVEEGTWVWGDGTPLKGWSDWGPGEPNNEGGKEDCGQWKQYTEYKWNDYACHYALFYMCEVGVAGT